MNKKTWVMKALIIFFLIFIFSIIFKSPNTKKEPFQYFSLCVPHAVRCGSNGDFNCNSESIFEGLVTDKGKCDYLKIPSIYETSYTRGENLSLKLPLDKVYPQIKPKIEGVFNVDRVDILRIGSNQMMLQHIKDNAGEQPNAKILGLDAYVNFGIDHQDDIYTNSTKGVHFFRMTIVAKDNSAHLRCLEVRPETFDLSGINQKQLCNVDALADDSLWYTYTIPYLALGQFEEINKSYSNLIKSFKYDIKH